MANDTTQPTPPLRALLAGLIDYAGTFPPASLSFADAVASYASYLRNPDAWMLNRLVVPVVSLSTLARHTSLFSNRHPCRASVVVPLDDEALAMAAAGRAAIASSTAPIVVEAVETRWTLRRGAGEGAYGVPRLDALLGRILDAISARVVFVELPVASADAEELESLVTSLAARRAEAMGNGPEIAAKIRCGGPTAAHVPDARALARALAILARHGVAWKATAGLHQPFTHQDASLGTRAFGFLNLFFAASVAHATTSDPLQLEEVLSDEDPSAFTFTSGAARWRALELPTEQLAAARDGFALTIGSCSFEEPLDGLRSANLLPDTS